MADLMLPLDPSQRHYGGYVAAMVSGVIYCAQDTYRVGVLYSSMPPRQRETPTRLVHLVQYTLIYTQQSLNLNLKM